MAQVELSLFFLTCPKISVRDRDVVCALVARSCVILVPFVAPPPTPTPPTIPPPRASLVPLLFVAHTHTHTLGVCMSAVSVCAVSVCAASVYVVFVRVL